MSDKIDAVIASMGWDLDAEEWADMRRLCEAALAQQPATAVREEWRYIIERVVDELDALNCAFRDQIDDEMADPEEEFDRCAATDELIVQARAMLAIAPAAPAPVAVPAVVREAVESAFSESPGWRAKIAAAVRALPDVGDPAAPPAAEQPDTENSALRAEIADLKARLLDAERGAEELVRLRANERDLRKLLAECADYLNYNELTSIGHGSILHRKMMEASK